MYISNSTYSNILFFLGILYTRLHRVRFLVVLFRLNCFHFSMKWFKLLLSGVATWISFIIKHYNHFYIFVPLVLLVWDPKPDIFLVTTHTKKWYIYVYIYMIQDFIDIQFLFVYTFNFSYQRLATIKYCPIFIPLLRNSLRSSMQRWKVFFSQYIFFYKQIYTSSFTFLMIKDSLNSGSTLPICLQTVAHVKPRVFKTEVLSIQTEAKE